MLAVPCILYLAAFICCVLSAIGKAPEWIAVLLLTVAGLLTCLPR
jgi:hypothetical protein